MSLRPLKIFYSFIAGIDFRRQNLVESQQNGREMVGFRKSNNHLVTVSPLIIILIVNSNFFILLKHTTTLFALSDHYILSQEC